MSVQRAPTTRDGYVMLLCELHTRTSTFFVNEKTQERHTEQKRGRKKWNKPAFALKFLYLILYSDDRYNFLYFFIPFHSIIHWSIWMVPFYKRVPVPCDLSFVQSVYTYTLYTLCECIYVGDLFQCKYIYEMVVRFFRIFFVTL